MRQTRFIAGKQMQFTEAAQRAMDLIRARELPPRADQENWRVVRHVSFATGAHFWRPQERVIGGDWLNGPLFPTAGAARKHILKTERPPSVKGSPSAFMVLASRQARHRQPAVYKETPQ